ncbi:MAG TPA: M1 family metallopeptidase [Planctomycetota bacterium]|nr:M1 family metallopeptidase [Planctomycetota bacterium]
MTAHPDPTRFSAGLAALALLCPLSGATQEPAASEEAAIPAPTATRARDGRSSRVDYEIKARLEEVGDGDGGLMRWKLHGEERLTWTNESGESVPDLWFHLYLNAFSNNRSTHMLGAGENLRGMSVSDLDREWWYGWQEVTRVLVDGVDVTSTVRYRQPDTWEAAADGEGFVREQDRSVMSVELPREIIDGQTAEIEIEWTSQLPRVRRRTGTKDDFLFVAQWFPKLGVYERERGWNCHQFHASTEFYSNYGTYRVALDLPVAYADRVAGSGVQVEQIIRDGRVETVFEAPSPLDRLRADEFGKLALVHDFTWTADPEYVVRDFEFRFDEWRARYAGDQGQAEAAIGADLRMRDVKVRVLVQPEHADQAQRHFEATSAGLYFYGLWFGEYPYEQVTVVDPAWGGGGAGGMEYPTLFTCGTALFTTADMYRPESVTVHECGHQFWYGLVGNNEFEAAWMDEGFNSYADSEALWRVYGPRRETRSYLQIPFSGRRVTSLPGGGRLGNAITATSWNTDWIPDVWHARAIGRAISRPLRSSDLVDWWRDQPLLTLVPSWSDPRWSDRAGYLRDPDSDSIVTHAWEYVDRSSYRTNSYPRPAVALRTLSGLVGYDAFLAGMRHYARQWRYRHPYPQDFYGAFNEGAGVDVGWYFEDAFESTRTIDWSVTVSQRVPGDELGYFPLPEGGFEERGRERDDEDTEDEESTADGDADGGGADDEGGEPEEASPEPENPRLATVLLRREGELCLPLKWRVTIEPTEDGEGGEETLDFTWTREQQLAQTWLRWKIELPADRRVSSVVLDPERVYYIDADMSDNQWFRATDDLAPLRWSERVFNQYTHLLHFYAGIGG